MAKQTETMTSVADLFGVRVSETRNKRTPQHRQADTRQVKNDAGGYGFPVSDMAALQRFLIYGVEQGTYYCGKHELALVQLARVARVIKEKGLDAVKLITQISVAGRAPSQEPGLAALAMAISPKFADAATRDAAANALPLVARTGWAFERFVDYAQQFRGWGRILRDAATGWFTSMSPEKLAYQAVKYQTREGWAMRDILRLAHVNTKFMPIANRAVFAWIAKGAAMPTEMFAAGPDILTGFEQLALAKTPREAAGLIARFNLPREAVPTQFLTSTEVWDALIEKAPLEMLLRNLGTISRLGMLDSGHLTRVREICARLVDERELQRVRIHPVGVFLALQTYKQEHGQRSDASWLANPRICDALEEAFYLSFKMVVPTGKRIMLAVDVSNSMRASAISNVPGLSAREAAGLLAMSIVRVEPNWCAVAFSAGRGSTHTTDVMALTPLELTPKMRLAEVTTAMAQLPYGGTDVALPMVFAAQKKLEIDAFCIYTDYETWAGTIHPFEALRQYRAKMGINAKVVCTALTPRAETTCGDPTDAGTLDVVGFDAAAPAVTADFIADRFCETKGGDEDAG